ncbi:hypothetical protein [Streptomyces sp. NBC_01210]|uniref:hypothetical protein n=1 Tax=Streptomyces sp. NBC_01210 TaxID=2903774 RepID=UPI003FA3C75D
MSGVGRVELRGQIVVLLGTPAPRRQPHIGYSLDLHVKGAKDWQRDPKQLRKLGF